MSQPAIDEIHFHQNALVHPTFSQSKPDIAAPEAAHHRVCCRCRVNVCSTAANAYCKPCRAAYQRAWRARRKTDTQQTMEPARTSAIVLTLPRIRLRGTPTPADLRRYGLA